MSAVLPKINDKLFIFVAVAVLLVVFVVVSVLRGVFDAYGITQIIDEESISSDPHLNVIQLDSAYDSIVNKEISTIDLPE